MAGSRTRTTLAALLISAFVGLTWPQAATRLTEDLTDLLQFSEAVAEVTVLAKKVEPTSALEIPVTLVTVQVRKVYKGEFTENSSLTVEYFGGFDGRNQVVVPAQPELNVGDRAVLLLIQARKPDGNWRILSGDTGQINLKTDAIGRLIAQRAHGHFTYFVGNKSAGESCSSAESTTLSADEFARLLHTTLDTGCPVLEGGAPVVATPPASAPCCNPLPSQLEVAAPAKPESSPVPTRVLIVLAVTTALYLVLRRAR
jgi:hypothetical protein